MGKSLKKLLSVLLAASCGVAGGVVPVAHAEGTAAAVKEFYHATWDDAEENRVLTGTSGLEATQFWKGNLQFQNWYDENKTTFVKDPDSTREGISIKTTVTSTMSFSAKLDVISSALKTALKDSDKKIYFSTDIYIPTGFDGECKLTWYSAPNNHAKRIGEFNLDETSGITAAGNTVLSADEMLNKWVTLGFVADKTDNTVSYYLNAEPVPGAQNVTGWDGSFDSLSPFMYLNTFKNNKESYDVYFDNMIACEVPDVAVDADLGGSAALPETIAVISEGESVAVEMTAAWGTADTSAEGIKTVYGKLGGYLPLVADVNVEDSTPEEYKYHATRIIDANFDSYTEGEDANKKPDGNVSIVNWDESADKYKQNPVFAKDSRGGVSVKTTRIEDYTSFGAVVKPSDSALTALKNENNSRLYLSCDVKVSNRDIVDYVGFWNMANTEQIAEFELHKFCGIRILEANNETVVSPEAFKADTWYNLGVLVDTQKKTVSYYVDGKPVTGAQEIQKSDTFMSTRDMSRLIYERNTIKEHSVWPFNMYYDNIKAYNLPKIEKTVEAGTENALPTVFCGESADGTVTRKTITWNNYSTDVGGTFEIAGMTEDKIPVTATLTVTDTTPENMIINAKEGFFADFEEFADGTAADGTSVSNARLTVRDWETQNNNGAYVNNPNGDGFVLKSTMQSGMYFSDWFAPSSDLKSILGDAANNKLYFSADFYLAQKPEKQFDLTWWAEANKTDIGMFIVDPTEGLKTKNGVVLASIDEIAGKWHRIGIIADKTNKSVSYFYNDQPIEGAQDISNGWDGSVCTFDRLFYARAEKTADGKDIYFDNMAAYTVPTVTKTVKENETVGDLPNVLKIEKSDGVYTRKLIDWGTIGTQNAGKETIYKKTGNAYAAAKIMVTGITLPYVISDNMIIQQQKPIKLWGYNSQGTVSAKIKNGDTVLSEGTTQAANNGEWSMELSALTAGGPYTIEFASDGITKTINNVMIGELWALDGQSNMAQRIAHTDWWYDSDNKCAPKERKENVRFFILDKSEDDIYGKHIKTAYNDSLKYENVKGKWLSIDPNDQESLMVSSVGATAVMKMYDELGVACGGIDISCGGTQISDFYADTGCVFRASHMDAIRQSMRGVLWYQGEYNQNSDYDEYKNNMLQLVADFRGEKAWNDSELYFIYVQLPAYVMDTENENGEKYTEDELLTKIGNWSMVRTSQLNALYELENAGMIATTDILPLTETNTVHRTNKKTIGERLGNETLRVAYKKNNIFAAPMFGSVEFSGNKATVTFTNVAGGLKTTDGNAPREFEISGEDGVWYGADAEIVGMDKIVLTSSNVAEPKKVRYLDICDRAADDETVLKELIAKGKPNVNLVNSEGLPTASFSEKENGYVRANLATQTTISYNVNDLSDISGDVKITINNIDDADSIYLALYNGSRLVDVKKAVVTNGSAETSISAGLLSDAQAEYSVRAFVWSAMLPIMTINSIK